ncbi:MAG: DUF1571 domain-containing protein [Deltaproteobacteria bacterium]|jgi:hypothetical protein|nr:DUF1571 domain-containing protein [Deltaproteobacteria bacterium]MBW2531860.1 DUF1571 domain-containing protein [Deltaproteobacteria bacterium]
MSQLVGADETIECHGHTVPGFVTIFPKVFRAGVAAMTAEQIDAVARSLSEADRAVLGNFLGAAGVEQVVQGLATDKAEQLAAHYRAEGERDDEAFRKLYPRLAATTNNTLSLEQLAEVLAELGAEEMASQSFFFGAEGRQVAFTSLKRDRVEAILDHTADWVLLETGRRGVDELAQYTTTLLKRERLDGKMQGEETIAIKVRHEPLAFHMKWLAGPFKKREVLYNDALYGPGKIRVREGGLLGVMPVTIGVDSAVARRGTKHLVTEVGLKPLVDLVDREYRKAAPAGDIQRKNHGITDLDGRPVYRMESILPRDESKGYYCYRMMHYTDFVRALEIKAEVYGFDDQVDEAFYYRDVDTSPSLTDADFDPKNKAYRL